MRHGLLRFLAGAFFPDDCFLTLFRKVAFGDYDAGFDVYTKDHAEPKKKPGDFHAAISTTSVLHVSRETCHKKSSNIRLPSSMTVQEDCNSLMRTPQHCGSVLFWAWEWGVAPMHFSVSLLLLTNENIITFRVFGINTTQGLVNKGLPAFHQSLLTLYTARGNLHRFVPSLFT